jgi:acyl-CoA reductase-like NAD-dependent aldehyde dehydrogenase
VVLKPASQTPLSALLLAELEEEAGLPPGWLNVVVGSASEIGDVLIDDERVTAITFTGSGTVGWKLKERAPRKRVNLELGNSTPVIVCDDAPPRTAEKIAANGFAYAGQSCISIQRVYVLDDAWDDFVRELVPKVGALHVGDPADEETDVGPVIDEDARDRILEWIRETRGEVVTGGDTTDDGLIRPTVILNPDASDKVQCEEVFGPVITLTRTRSLDEAIELANSTRYGLQAGIFTENINTALRAAAQLEFGGVTINEAPTFRADQMPYGGVKASGNTREGPHYAVRELTEERVVVIDLP